ncbi:MAG: acyltransferase domain-containing protein [Pseudonocardiaceae bacterium]
MTSADEYRLLGVTAADRADIENLDVDEAAVGEFAATLRRLLGTFPGERDLQVPTDPHVSLVAFLATLPDVRRYHQGRGISDKISWATLADLGRQLGKHRRIDGQFGLRTHWWMCTHWTGVIYQLGRLQYLIHQPARPVPGVEPEEWVLGLHIPEAGPLMPELVDESLAQAKAFFTRHFPERPVRIATLRSWLLDPYLLDTLPPESNIVRFGRRFTPYGEATDGQKDAVYFIFHTRSMQNLDRLPRDTTLRRLVLNRMADGGIPQNASGYLIL